jgi:DNA-binding transcriptional MocR family regulator
MQSSQPTKKLIQPWLRRLSSSNRPAYLLIADMIAEDVSSGRLVARDKLPTLRVLAEQLRLDYTTVARAYAEARKRGLLDSRPGMGTFIRGTSPSLPLRGGGNAEMTMNLPPEPDNAPLLQHMHESASRLMAQVNLYDLMRYQDVGGLIEDKEAATEWLRQLIPDCDPHCVLLSPGIHAALAALVCQLVRPGELICVEALTYPGIKAIASHLGVKLHPLTIDDEGPSAAEFEIACKTLQPKALYCNPTMLNPTTTTISRRRREALADIALRYSIPIIEDDAYALMPASRLPTIASIAPQLTYYITGLSKFLGAGLRTAYVCAPTPHQTQRLAGALRAMTVMGSTVTNAIATQWVMDGTAHAMLNAVRAESIARQQLASKYLIDFSYDAQPECFHLWLRLPAERSSAEFASQLRAKGIGVVASAAFCTTGDAPDAIRVALGGPQTRAACELSLKMIVETLKHPVHPEASAI